MLQLVDKADQRVISLFKIKTIEYQLIRLMQKVLGLAIEKKEVETQLEKVFQSYMREHRALVKTVTMENLPHPEAFYADIFSNAYNLLNSRKTKDF